jgi:hypothetical protein
LKRKEKEGKKKKKRRSKAKLVADAAKLDHTDTVTQQQ